jgi:hypothetical protein
MSDLRATTTGTIARGLAVSMCEMTKITAPAGPGGGD